MTFNLAETPGALALIGRAMQAKIDAYHAEYTARVAAKVDRPVVRWNQPLLDRNGATIIAVDLLTDLRTIATKLDKNFEFAKTAQLIAFAERSLGCNIHRPDFRLTTMPARPAREVPDPVTGLAIPLPARGPQVVATYGEIPSSLSPAAKMRNAAANAAWDALLTQFFATNPVATPADTTVADDSADDDSDIV